MTRVRGTSGVLIVEARRPPDGRTDEASIRCSRANELLLAAVEKAESPRLGEEMNSRPRQLHAARFVTWGGHT